MTRSLCLKIATLLSLATIAGAGVAADAPAAAVQQTSASQTSIEQIDDLDEIWVRGKSLSVIIEKAEDDFFALYNKLNKNSQFDVYCGQMALAPRSMLMVRACTPGFVVYNSYDARTNSVAYSYTPCPMHIDSNPYMESNGDMYYMANSDSLGSCLSAESSLSQVVPTGLLLMEKRPAYEKNVRAVISGDPRLREMVKKLGGLYDEMDHAQRHYVKVRGVLKPDMSFKSRSRSAKPSGGPRVPL